MSNVDAKLSVPNEPGGSSKLRLKGVLDHDSLTHDFWHALPQENKDSVMASHLLEVDLENVERADTAGLAWLINLVKDLSNAQVEVRFSNIPDKLTNLAALSGADILLNPSL